MTSTREDLVRDFRALGLGLGDLVMLHSSYKALGPVERGPATVAEALMQVLGEAGGVLVFGSWAETTYDLFVKEGGPSETQRAAWPAFLPETAPLRPSYAGAIGQALFVLPGARRSANPDRSLVALGERARALIEDHPLDHGFGPETPLARFVEAGGKSILLGAPYWTVSAIHYAEYLARVPGKRTVAYEVPLLRDGRKTWVPVEQMGRDGFIEAVQGWEQDYIEVVVRAFLEQHGRSPATVGRARTFVLEAPAFVEFAVAWFEERYGEA